MKLPTVKDFLSEEERARAVFLKPAIGKELAIVYGLGRYYFREATDIAVRLMTLQPDSVVPFHMHPGKGDKLKDKLYFFLGASQFKVVIQSESQMTNQVFTMDSVDSRNKLVIPAGHPHCLIYFPRHQRVQCTVLVVASSPNADIIWEDDAEKLVLNEHLKSAD